MTRKQTEAKNFDADAALWDEHPGKVKMAGDAAAAILREIKLTSEMEVMDFGCGTGLLGLKLLPLVKSLTGVDSSQGMLAVLRNKIETLGLTNVQAQLIDFASGERPGGSYHLIVSSMTLHHVPDTAALFSEWFDLLHPGGQVAFADLDTEDGSFHSDNTGVFHFGFDRNKLTQLLHVSGFGEVRATTASAISKEVSGQGTREFTIFLITASKPSA
ncbi:MAG: class I SAM-dependent methyltransferase [Gallionellaceae bacterium]|jgi:2-polyprenyl-3-methyl-5-hydroxy-6-metoxy-1,4-benzoquinol methylase